MGDSPYIENRGSLNRKKGSSSARSLNVENYQRPVERRNYLGRGPSQYS